MTADGRSLHAECVGQAVRAALWEFDHEVAVTFPEHARSHIPCYVEGHDLVLAISDIFMPRGAKVYDLGTGVGELLSRLASRHAGDATARFIGIDHEPAMARLAADKLHSDSRVEIRVESVAELVIEPCNLVLAYHVLQFVPPSQRHELLLRLQKAIRPEGAFLRFEKVLGVTGYAQHILDYAYQDFKHARGVDPCDALQKSRRLAGMMFLRTEDDLRQEMLAAGFSEVLTVFAYGLFRGFLVLND